MGRDVSHSVRRGGTETGGVAWEIQQKMRGERGQDEGAGTSPGENGVHVSFDVPPAEAIQPRRLISALL